MRFSKTLLVLSLVGPAFGVTPALAAEPGEAVVGLTEITNSDEFRFSHAEVLRLYFAFFDRAPDLAGAKYWVEVNNQGYDVLDIAGFFEQSLEFDATYGQPDDEAFLEVVYANVLGRAPDAGGLAYWLGLLESGQLSRAGVMVYFAAGSEFADAHRFATEPTLMTPFTFGPSDGPVTYFFVHAEEGAALDEQVVVLEVQGILSDYRSWITSEQVRFRRVDELGDADVEVFLATPATVDARCAPLKTNGRLSCRNGSSLNINVDRWNTATSGWSDSISEYRAYVINHEMGHFLGKGHVSCPGAGQLAPVMQQQTKAFNGCKPNGWPNPR